MASIRIFPGSAQTATPDFDLSGDRKNERQQMTGALQVTRPALRQRASTFSRSNLTRWEIKPVSFRVTADGGVKAGQRSSARSWQRPTTT